jgi:hypothetical protein
MKKTSAIIRDTIGQGHICDSVVCRNGVFIAKRTYYYRHGLTPRRLSQIITATLKDVGININVVDTSDNWHAWPKQSYFEVRFTVV